MSDSKPRLGSGDITIILNEKEYTLRPTLKAAMMLSRTSGGIRGAIDAVMQMNMDVIATVIKQGLGQHIVRQFKQEQLEEAIWETGLTDTSGGLLGKCVEYLHTLANGGRPINQNRDEDQDPQTLQ